MFRYVCRIPRQIRFKMARLMRFLNLDHQPGDYTDLRAYWSRPEPKPEDYGL